MAENLSWLFGAFAIGWALIFGYLFWMSNRERELRRKLSDLQTLLEEQPKR